jgi:hypothetical protein
MAIFYGRKHTHPHTHFEIEKCDFIRVCYEKTVTFVRGEKETGTKTHPQTHPHEKALKKMRDRVARLIWVQESMYRALGRSGGFG